MKVFCAELLKKKPKLGWHTTMMDSWCQVLPLIWMVKMLMKAVLDLMMDFKLSALKATDLSKNSHNGLKITRKMNRGNQFSRELMSVMEEKMTGLTALAQTKRLVCGSATDVKKVWCVNKLLTPLKTEPGWATMIMENLLLQDQPLMVKCTLALEEWTKN